jgi:hypothetical protein
VKYPKTICDLCGAPKTLRFYPSSKTSQWRCKPCDVDKDRERRNAIKAGLASQKKIPRAKPVKPIWQPVWAAQSPPEIVAAIRDYRRAIKSLGVRT